MILRESLVVFLSAVSLGFCLENEEPVDSFSQVDVREINEWPVRVGLQFWDDRTDRYKKIPKSLGSSLNTGLWSTLWEVSAAAPAPWYSDDERMDLWIGTIYRNLYGKHDAMRNATYFFGNHSIEIIGRFLGVPEAYSLSVAQKKYRAEKAAEEKGTEPDLTTFYVTHNGLDIDRIDDLGKFFAASVDHLKGLGVTLPYVELFDEIAVGAEDTFYISPSEVVYLVNKTREELDARSLYPQDVKIVVPGVRKPAQLKPYLKAFAEDKEAYDKLYAISTKFVDNGSLPLTSIEKQAINLIRNLENIIPSEWDKKPVVVTGLAYEGPTDVEYNGMRYYGDIKQCYEDKHQRTGHETLKDSICQIPAFAVRNLAAITILLSHGLPWIAFQQAADPWWVPACDGLLDKNDKPKQLLAALETVVPYFTNETFPVKKQWKNYDECYIAAFRSLQKSARYIVTVTNYSPQVCERSFSLKGIELWDIKKAHVTTYNNGTVSLDADKPYRALISKKTLNYDIYDEEDGSYVGPEIEFDLTVGPYASATAVIDARISKGKKKKPKPKKEPASTVEEDEYDDEEEIEFDEDDDEDIKKSDVIEQVTKSSDGAIENGDGKNEQDDDKSQHTEL